MMNFHRFNTIIQSVPQGRGFVGSSRVTAGSPWFEKLLASATTSGSSHFCRRCIHSSKSNYLSEASSNNDDSSTEAFANIKSNRALFKEIPVHPSITKYIELIGVGIAPRRRRNRKKRKGSTTDSELFLLERDQGGRRRKRRGNNPKRSTTDSKDDQHISNSMYRTALTPPPPFRASNPAEEKRKVLIIGSVASTQDTFPENIGTIPEVVCMLDQVQLCCNFCSPFLLSNLTFFLNFF